MSMTKFKPGDVVQFNHSPDIIIYGVNRVLSHYLIVTPRGSETYSIVMMDKYYKRVM